MCRLLPTLLPLVSLVAFATAARAQTPPALTHIPVERCERGQPLKLSARIQAAGPATIFEPTAFLRAVGAEKYLQLPLFSAGGDLYEAVVPGALTRSAFEYYLEAFDSEGNGPARAGLPRQPLRVEVFDPAPVDAKVAVVEPAAPRPPSSSPIKPTGIALTAVGAAALAAGGACAWLASSSLSAEHQAVTANDPAAWDRAHSDLEARRTSAVVLLSAGAAIALTGALLWGLAPAPPVTLAPALAPQGAGFALAGRF
ncbi:MAG: hypothetical protein HY901_17100 [Deltaproteobacteria bacterium]|nr:hypothetical protein [Deltaproteobacteria bacterium]